MGINLLYLQQIMIFTAINTVNFDAISATTLTGLAKGLSISTKQLRKYVNKPNLFQRKWIISATEPVKCKKIGRYY